VTAGKDAAAKETEEEWECAYCNMIYDEESGDRCRYIVYTYFIFYFRLD